MLGLWIAWAGCAVVGAGAARRLKREVEARSYEWERLMALGRQQTRKVAELLVHEAPQPWESELVWAIMARRGDWKRTVNVALREAEAEWQAHRGASETGFRLLAYVALLAAVVTWMVGGGEEWMDYVDVIVMTASTALVVRSVSQITKDREYRGRKELDAWVRHLTENVGFGERSVRTETREMLAL